MWRKKSKKSSHRLIIVIAIFIIFTGTFAFIAKNFGLFTIKKIDTVIENIPCVDENNLKNVSNLLGETIFKVNFKNTAQNLKSKFYCIKNINIAYVFPSKTKITAVGRQPVAVLLNLKDSQASASANLENIATPSAEQPSEAYLIDDEGIIFSKDSGGLSIPELFVKEANLILGKSPQGINIESTLKILDKIKIFGMDTKKGVISSNFLIIFSDPKVIFKLDDKVEVQLASLQLILAEAKIISRKLEFIDLRFDKPIVRFAPKKNG